MPQRPVDLHASHFHQFQNIRCRFEQMTSGVNNSPTNNVRRYTSENNLNDINTSSKPALVQKNLRPPPVQTTATSTEDLSNIPAWKKLSPQARLSALLDKTNHAPTLTANGASASLIDLTSIDKAPKSKQVQPPPLTRPRFRFVPPSDKNAVLKEEPEPDLEQHVTPSNQNYDNVELNTPSPNRTPTNLQSSSSLHQQQQQQQKHQQQLQQQPPAAPKQQSKAYLR